MLKNAELYDFSQNLQGKIFYAAVTKHLSEEARTAMQERPAVLNLRRGYAESPMWMMIQMLEFYPEGITVEKFRRRAIYSAPKLSLAIMELLASEALLDRHGETYFLTEQGKKEGEKIKQNRINPFMGFAPLGSDLLGRLEAYMRRLIDASFESTDTDRWSLVHSRNRAPSEDAPVLAKLMQYGSDFNAFRDDCHMAAYEAYGVEGHVWEAFSYVKAGKGKDADALYQQLAYRGYYTEDWQAALDDLVGRAWFDGEGLTEEGEAVWDDVEAKTDAYFYAPWRVLADAEFDEMVTLMRELESVLDEMLA